ncbi:MAG: phasin family protein [Bacteroidales bacterium]|jgi:polyhydroxyalkanoate synthesis regulator phasin|nr:phasin family protein [Bacteroidales bacterium]
MLEELKKSIDKGLDYAALTRDKITQAAKELAKENKLTKEEAKKLLDHWLKKSEETRKSIESDIQHLIQTTLKKMNVPTQEDIRILEGRLKKLEVSHKTPAKPKAVPTVGKSTKPVAARNKK